MGIVGNGIAIGTLTPGSLKISIKKVSSSSKTYINQYILRWFYVASLIAVIVTLPQPIIKYFSDQSHNWVWTSLPWVTYVSAIYYPLSNTLMSCAFQITVIFFMTQVVAVLLPFRYKQIVNRRNFHLALILTSVYCAVWYAPTTFWFYIVRYEECSPGYSVIPDVDLSSSYLSPPINNFVKRPTSYIYSYNFWIPPKGRRFDIWVAYEIAREMAVYILPFSIMISTKLFILKKRSRVGFAETSSHPVSSCPTISQQDSYFLAASGSKSIHSHKPSFKHQPGSGSGSVKDLESDQKRNNGVSQEFSSINTSSMYASISYVEVSCSKKGKEQKVHLPPETENSLNKFSLRSLFRVTNTPAVTHIENDTTVVKNSSSQLGHHIENIKKNREKVLKRRHLEQKHHKRTLVIFTCEFIFLILPSSLLEMSFNFLLLRHDAEFLANLDVLFTLLQFIYIGCSFYLNLAFNKYYRQMIFKKG